VTQSTDEHSDQLKLSELSRRTVCVMGAGLSATALLDFGGAPARAAEADAIRYVVTDRRFEQSMGFGAILAARGVRPLEVTDGLTRLWHEALVPLWREKGGPVAGITDRGTWACIAEQARSHGRRSVLVGHHMSTSDSGSTSHSLAMSMPPTKVVELLDRCGKAWPQAMADLVIRYPTAARPVPDKCYHGPAAAGSPSSIALTSWIIA
jgi:hypothetical protein